MRTLMLAGLLCISFPGAAQKIGQAYLDSLLAALPAEKEDTNKSILLYKIGVAYSTMDQEKTMAYARAGLAHAENMQWEKGIGAFYHLIGSVLMNKAQYDSAILYYNKSYELDKRLKDDHGMCADLINMGLTEATRGDAGRAMSYLVKALPLAELTRDTNYLSLIYNNISNIYFFQKDYKKATDYTNKALQLAKLGKNEENIANALTSLGTFAHELKDTARAMGYYEAALEVYIKYANIQRQASLLGNIGMLQKDKRKGIEYKLKAQAIWDTLAPSYADAIKNTGNLGIDYYDLAINPGMYIVQYDDTIPRERAKLTALSEKYLTSAVRLSKVSGNMEWYWSYALNLSELYELKGDYKNALAYMKLYTRVHDSLYSQENKNQLAGIAGEREIALRDKEIELNKISMSAQRRQRVGLVGGILLLGIIGALLYWQTRTRKRTNTTLLHLNNELDEANKIKARFFAILSHDLRSPVANLVSFLELQQEPGMMNAEQTAAHQKRIGESARSLLDNMESMLLWSKGQMEQFKPQVNMVVVGDLFHYLQSFFSNTENVQISFSDPNRAMVSTDENYLQTIMYNLTANAIKVLKDTPGATIEWKTAQENGKTILSITDNGPGISASQVKALYNEAAVANTKTGFGLHLIRDLAKAINCTISLEKGADNGTTFRLAV
jgi:signal transduction histidine kinase